jgi:hypothetical protein
VQRKSEPASVACGAALREAVQVGEWEPGERPEQLGDLPRGRGDAADDPQGGFDHPEPHGGRHGGQRKQVRD